MQFFEYFACKKVMPLVSSRKCPSCGSLNGQVVDAHRFKESLDAGAYFDIDPKTGSPAKKKK